MIHSYKARYKDLHFIVASDWNRADTNIALDDFPSLTAVLTPPTRGDDVLDIIFTNMHHAIVETEVTPPLLPDMGRPGRPSDHNVIVVKYLLPRNRKFKWFRYSYRKYTLEGDAAFGDWILDHDWSEIRGNSSEMAESLGRTLDRAIDSCFSLITRRLRSDQDPWINVALERMIERRKKIFRIQGRSKSWKKIKKRTEEIIRERKRVYLEYQVKKSSEKGGLGNRFAALAKPFMSVDKVADFDVKTLCSEGASDIQAAEECADYFSAISDEFVPLDVSLLPSTHSIRLIPVQRTEIIKRLKSFKKPRSMVPGDIFPQLVTNYAVSLSEPLEWIYKSVFETYHWPLVWRNEYVTIIPKCPDPEDLGSCRNISCTNLFSKILESFMLERSWAQVEPNLKNCLLYTSPSPRD